MGERRWHLEQFFLKYVTIPPREETSMGVFLDLSDVGGLLAIPERFSFVRLLLPPESLPPQPGRGVCLMETWMP